MKHKVFILLLLLLVAGSIYAIDPWGDPTLLTGSMTVMAEVRINAVPTAVGDVLAAFVTVGETEQLRGKAAIQINNSVSGCLIQVYTETNGEVVTFKVWDESAQTVFPVVQTLVSEVNAIIGSWPDNLYQINAGLQEVSTPDFTPPAGIYTSAQSVVISTSTADAQIYYTTTDADPDEDSTPYTGPVFIGSSLTLKARAYKDGWVASSIASAAYLITGTVATPAFDPPAGTYVTAQNVAISCATVGAQIRYTTDGNEPTTDSALYTAPIYVDVSTTLKAKAFLQDWEPSATATAEYNLLISVADPVILPEAGTYIDPIQVTISTSTPGATIRFTMDGNDPSETLGVIYTVPINLTETTTIKAIAYKTGMVTSQISTAAYVITPSIPVVAAPMYSLPSGTYQAAIDIAISTTTAEAAIRYTTDGSEPSATAGILYTSPIHIGENSNVLIKAIAYRTGWTSSWISIANYIVTGTVADVQFSLPSGTYTTAQNLLLSTATAGASIHYTTDGSEPTQSSNLYNYVPIVLPLNSTQTVRARAFKQDWIPSAITQNTYTITGQVQITAPVFSLVSGTYTTAQLLFLNNPVPAGAVVHYTLDGTDPVLSSPIYASPINLPLNTTLTVKARAFLDEWLPSPIYSASYVITGQVILPAVLFNPPAGTYQTAQTIVFNPPQLPIDADLRYTLDGNEPSLSSPAYQNPINLGLNSTTTIKVKGFRTDWIPSETVTAVYVITGQVVFNTPVFSPAPGVYTTAQMITVNSAVPADAQVKYTTDGTEPTETSTVYTAPISLPLNTALTLKVKAFKANWTPSEIITGSYTTTGSVSIELPVFSPPPGIYTAAQTVLINTTTLPAGATLHYTTNGTDPNETSPVYTTAIPVGLDQTMTIKVRAYLANWLPSAISTGTYTVTGQANISAPVFMPPAGTYATTQFVSINTSTYPAGAAVRYTLDGTEPTESSQLYTAAIPINNTTTVKAKAFASNWLPSQTYSAIYVITGTVATPTFNPPAGTYATPQNVTLACATAGASIRFTTNGNEPTASSDLYTSPIAIPLNTTMTIKAKAFLTDWTPSNTATATYVITGTVATPTFNPPAETYTTAQNVSISCATAGATIRYTTNGNEPTEASPAYINPIPVPLNTTMTIKAKGFRADWIPSSTAQATYQVTGQVAFNTPVFSPAPGVYATAQVITVNSTIPADAVIRYTLDGSEPTETSAQYTSPIPLPLHTELTLKVKAFKAGWTASQTYTGAYTSTGSVSIVLPVFTPEPGIYTSAQSIVLNTTTLPAGATLHYTVDGSEPNESSPVYVSPIQVGLGQSVTIRVRAYLVNWFPSVVYSGVYTVTGQVSIADPVFTPAAGTYSTAQIVTINTISTPAGATVRYTLDGADPTAASPVYTTPIQLGLNSQTTIKARAFLQNWAPSQVYSANYHITATVATPTFDPPAGSYNTAQNVSLACTTPGAIIRFTTNGAEPTEASPAYTTPIVLPLASNTTIKARAFKTNWMASATASATYIITGTVAVPVFALPAGTYTTAQNLVLSCATAGATIRYTTNGTEPTEASPAYSSPLNVPLGTTLTIKARGYKTGWNPSSTATATYTVTGTVAPPEFSPPGGIYGNPVSVEISTATLGAEIHYTLNGTDPTPDSELYAGPILIPNFTESQTIKARAYKAEWLASTVSSVTYSVLPLPIDVIAYSYAGFIKVQWSLPEPLRALQGFNVYRRKLSETTFTKLNSSLIGPQTFSYEDHAIELNVHYKYQVKAVYNGIESPASSTVDIVYQSQNLQISDASFAYPNPAEDATTLRLILNRNENIRISVSIYDFSGKKIQTLPAQTVNAYQVELPWDLKNLTGNKVGRGTYFASIVANDGVNRFEKVIKIAVK